MKQTCKIILYLIDHRICNPEDWNIRIYNPKKKSLYPNERKDYKSLYSNIRIANPNGRTDEWTEDGYAVVGTVVGRNMNYKYK